MLLLLWNVEITVFKKEDTTLSELEYRNAVTEILAIVEGMPDFDEVKLTALSAACCEVSFKLEGNAEDVNDLRQLLKLASAAFIYNMQLTKTVLKAVKEVERLSGNKILHTDKPKLAIVESITKHKDKTTTEE